MAKNSPSNIFTPDVGGINDPVSADGGGLIRAANTAAQGKLALAESNAKTIEVAGGTALEAYKGKLLADAERDIKDSLNKLEGYGESAVDATKKLNYLQSNEFAANASIQLEMLAQQTKEFDNDPTVKDFLTTIGRYKAAESQKVLSKQDVLNRIAATVKQYTAMMPGWGSEFRKAAAELTGISNIDVLGVHTALTQESARDKQNEMMIRKRIDFVAEVGNRFGVSPEKVTPAMEQQHYQDKQVAVVKENSANQLAIADATDKQRERYLGEYVSATWMEGIAKVGNAMNQFRQANAGVDIKSKDAQTQIGGQVLGYLNDIESVIVRDIQSKTQRSAENPYPVTYDQAQKYIKDTRDFLKTYKDNLASEGGWNAFTLSVQAAEGNYQRMLANLQVAHPYVSVLAKTGVLPEVTKLYMTLGGDMTKMEATVGKPAAAAIQSFITNPFGANAMASAQIFPTAEAATEVLGEAQVKVNWLDVNRTIDEYAKKPELSQGERTNVVNKLITYANWFSATDAKAMEEFKNKVNSGEFVKLATMMTTEEKQKAFTPFFRKAEIAAKQIIPRLAQFASEAAGQVTFDPATNMFGVKFNQGATFVDGIGGSPRIELQRQVANINSVASLMNDLKDEVFPGEAPPDFPVDMANLYGKILEDKVKELETKKAGVEAAKDAALSFGDVTSNAAMGTDTFSKDIKNLDSQINAAKRGIEAIGKVQVKAAPGGGEVNAKELTGQDFKNAVKPWQNAPASAPKPEKQMRQEMLEGGAEISDPNFSSFDKALNDALDVPYVKGAKSVVTARPPLEAVKNLDRLIAAQSAVTNSSTATPEQKKRAVLNMQEAQMVRIEKIGHMSEEEKDAYYGSDRTR